MIGCLPRVLEVSRVVDDTEVPGILWVKCATSAQCKTIRIAVSTVKDSWVTTLGLRRHVYKPSVCVDKTTWVKSRDLTWLSWVGAHSIYVDICNLSSWLLEFSWCMSYKLLNMSLHSKLAFCKNLPISCIVVSWTKTWVACEYIQSTHWLATRYFIGQAWKNRIWWRILRWRTCELGRFPVRMPVGLRQMAWVQVVIEDFRCDDTLKTWP